MKIFFLLAMICLNIPLYTTAQNGKVGEAVDLGLSVKWASWNVGASKPEEYGGYFAWGEIEEKDMYDWSTYKYCDGKKENCFEIGTNGDDICNTEYDVAYVKWGSNWRMPTREEVEELQTKCTITKIMQNGVEGWRFTGPNGNSIFIPSAGYVYDFRNDVWHDMNDKRGSAGFYWTGKAAWSSMMSGYENHSLAICGFFGEYNGKTLCQIDFRSRESGFPVRPVQNNESEPIPSPTYNYATISWTAFQDKTTQKEYKLKLGINSDSKVESVTITVNGIQDRGIKTVNSSDYDLTINRTLTLNEGANVIKVSVRNAAGTAQEEKTIVYRPQGGELPTINWLVKFAPTTNKKEYQIKLGIKSKTKIEQVNIALNDDVPRGINLIETNRYDMTIDRTLTLKEGLNRVVVSVRNGDGIATSEQKITIQGDTTVFNDKRIALVIGNSEYQGNINSLANPRNDAEDITSKLKSLGFEVKVLYDGTKKGMNEAINSFVVQARNYDVALFYYAGHGLQLQTDIGGANYLIPVDANLVYKSDAEHDCVNANRIVSQMEASGCKIRLVVLDACRDLPNLLDSHRGSSPKGFSEIRSAVGTYILYSTREGKTASDGKGRNSPFAEGILKYIDVPNQPVERFFKNVGAWVDQVTNNEQNPWPSGRINGDFYFNKQ